MSYWFGRARWSGLGVNQHDILWIAPLWRAFLQAWVVLEVQAVLEVHRDRSILPSWAGWEGLSLRENQTRVPMGMSYHPRWVQPGQKSRLGQGEQQRNAW